jgi:hypothetical protein
LKLFFLHSVSVEKDGPYSGTYMDYAPTSEFGGTREWQPTYGATNANLTVITRLQAIDGEFERIQPTSSKVDINHNLTLYELAWVYCLV